jgi:anti-anti-sigma factor
VLDITVERSHDVVTVRCYGRLVYGRETALFCAAVPRHRRDILVDLSGVTAIDAAGIGALMSLRAFSTHLTLVDPSQSVRQILGLTNLDSVFDIFESDYRREAMVSMPRDVGEIHSRSLIQPID